MPRTEAVPDTIGPGAKWFTTTHWTVILSAKEGDSPQAIDAMEKLCRTYWGAVYAFIRREGHDAEDARDLTQEFFAQFLAKDHLKHLRHQQGRFRSFMLTFVKHFLSAERARARAQKRAAEWSCSRWIVVPKKNGGWSKRGRILARNRCLI